jgi:hypothetical protein
LADKAAEADREKTAFSAPSGSYCYRKLPFGIANAPRSFQLLMDVVLKELKDQECWIFLDDIIFSQTPSRNTRRLEYVYQRFEKANLLPQPAKSVFAKSEVQYLGYTVTRDGIAACPDKLKAVRE